MSNFLDGILGGGIVAALGGGSPQSQRSTDVAALQQALDQQMNQIVDEQRRSLSLLGFAPTSKEPTTAEILAWRSVEAQIKSQEKATANARSNKSLDLPPIVELNPRRKIVLDGD